MTKNSKDVRSYVSNYQLVCGMEIHAELKTKSKMFCGCKNDPFGAKKPNIYTCPVCLGLPGALPVPNKKAIEWTIKLGLALNCKINLFSKFDRKHYFYPDLPKGYQISQYDIPFCYDGFIETTAGKIGITRIHLEEDTAKLIHKEIDGKKVSLIDFNRSSVPLIEIVSEPDIKTAKQAKEYSKKLRQIMRFLDISNCDMEQGGMRLEANVSLAKPQSKDLPDYKVELKNINSFRFLEQGINFETKRQTEILDKNETPSQETRGYNPNTGKTFIQRSKETAEDYRYFPDPDIPPIRFSQTQVDKLRSEIPALPDQLVNEWEKDYGVESRFGEELIKQTALITFFNNIFTAAKDQKLDVNKLAKLLVNKKINPSPEMERKSGSRPGRDQIGEVKRVIDDFKNLTQTDSVDQSELERIIKEVMAENPSESKRFKDGEKKLLNFFVGQVMRKLGKKVDMKILMPILNKTLKS